jgi:hypothetical protein
MARSQLQPATPVLSLYLGWVSIWLSSPNELVAPSAGKRTIPYHVISFTAGMAVGVGIGILLAPEVSRQQ